MAGRLTERTPACISHRTESGATMSGLDTFLELLIGKRTSQQFDNRQNTGSSISST